MTAEEAALLIKGQNKRSGHGALASSRQARLRRHSRTIIAADGAKTTLTVTCDDLAYPGARVNAFPNKNTESEARCEPRTSVFVMATLSSLIGYLPVKVRDVSPTGALIEGGEFPPPGTSVRLSRGSLNVSGVIAWCKNGRAGVRFGASTSVAEWLPKGQANAHQQRVDKMVQHVKACGMRQSLSPDLIPASQANNLSSVELTRLRRAIESLADDLAADPDIVERHMAKLQALDLVAQALRSLAAER